MNASLHSINLSAVSLTARGGETRAYLYRTICTVNLLALCGGISVGWIAKLLKIMLDPDELSSNPLGYVLTSFQAGWIVSLLPLGGVFGAYVSGVLSQKIGRKKSLLISCAIPIFVSFTIMAFSKTLGLFYVSRFLAGIGVSSSFAVVPLYSGEVAEDINRGQLCSAMMIFQSGGTLFVAALSPYISIQQFCLTAAAMVAVAFVVIAKCLPESPYYLVKVKKHSEAADVLRKLRSTFEQEIYRELELIQEVMTGSIEEQGSLMSIFKRKSKAHRKAFVIAVSLILFQNLSGVIPILFYAQLIYAETGNEISQQAGTIAIGFVNLCTSLVTPSLVGMFGRRWMLFGSACGMWLFQFALGVYFACKRQGYKMDNFVWMPVVCMMFYFISYSMGFGPLAWTVMAEIFPINMKSAAVTVIVSIWWISAFLLTKYFPVLQETVGTAGCFWIYSFHCICAATFVVTYLVETKGKSFREIEESLNK